MMVRVIALKIVVVGQKPTNQKTNMKKLLSVFAVLSLITSIAAFGADEKKKYTEGSCCAKAEKKGEKCKHTEQFLHISFSVCWFLSDNHNHQGIYPDRHLLRNIRIITTKAPYCPCSLAKIVCPGVHPTREQDRTLLKRLRFVKCQVHV